MTNNKSQLTFEPRRFERILLSAAVFCLSNCAILCAQTAKATSAPSTASEVTPSISEIEHRLSSLTAALRETQQTLEKSLLEIQNLHAQLDALRAKNSVTTSSGVVESSDKFETAAPLDTPQKDDLALLHEEQEALQAEIKQHEQVKVETSSRYPLRVTGLVLFNAFSNVGVVDDPQLPTLAFARNYGSSHGSNGATMRQTVLGLEASGPRLAGAHSSAVVSMDFFGGLAQNAYGYNSPTGVLRMRQSHVTLDWQRTTVEAGFTGPLISPLSPASFATVAQPALSGSGNLWTWSPQLRVEQRIPLSDQNIVALEAGLIYPQSPGYSSPQLVSPVEASRRPGYEGRLSYQRLGTNTGAEGRFMVGVGGYSAQQSYESTHLHSWAVTGDWRIPILKRFELSGELYRGRAIAGLGGGEYRDLLTGIDTVSGLARSKGVEAAGGWTQLKIRPSPTFEVNAIYGLDDAFSSNFDGLSFPASTNPLPLYARNSSVVGNLVFRPRTYLILSPEYRRLHTWQYSEPGDVANIFTITAGYQF